MWQTYKKTNKQETSRNNWIKVTTEGPRDKIFAKRVDKTRVGYPTKIPTANQTTYPVHKPGSSKHKGGNYKLKATSKGQGPFFFLTLQPTPPHN